MDLVAKWSRLYGPMWLPGEVSSKLEEIPEEEDKLKAVNLILEYFHHVCKATSSSREFFCKSKNRHTFSLTEKLQHLDAVFQQNPYLFDPQITLDGEEDSPLDILDAAEKTVKQIKHKSELDERKRQVKATRQLLPSIKSDPKQLVCRKFELKQIHGDEISWLLGKILHPIKKFK